MKSFISLAKAMLNGAETASADAAVEFEVMPFFYETRLFQVMVTVTLAGLLLLIIRLSAATPRPRCSTRRCARSRRAARRASSSRT